MQRFFATKIAGVAAVSAAIVGGGFNRSASAITYDRNAAVNYGNANWNKVVNDGYFWINSSTENQYGAGTAVPVNVSGEASGIGDDCAHFVSSVIGKPGGGLTIPSRGYFSDSYGEPGAARLCELLVGNTSGGYGSTYKYGTQVSSVSQLTPGDIIGYDWDGSGGGSMSGIDHVAFYVGNSKVDCHATSHLGVNYTLGGADDYFFVHITTPDSIVPTAPTNSSPKNTTVYTNKPKLTGSAFSDGAIGSTQTAAEWLVKKGSSTIYDSGIDTTNLTSLTLPGGLLTGGVSYTWQVKYQDNYTGWSTYSAASTFAVPEPATIGLVFGAMPMLMRRRSRV